MGKLFREVEIARKRVNARIADEAVMIQNAIVSVLGGKQGQKSFEASLKGLRNG